MNMHVKPSPAPDDPIFDLIAKHRAATETLERELDARMEALACKAERAALRKMVETAPRTLCGAQALVAWVLSQHLRGNNLLSGDDVLLAEFLTSVAIALKPYRAPEATSRRRAA